MWERIYRDRVLGPIVDPNEIELTQEDVESGELDRFMEEQERQWKAEHQSVEEVLTGGTRTMSGAKAPLDWNQMQAEPVIWGRSV
jgi:hypothetical protein